MWDSKSKKLVKAYKFYKENDEHEYMDIMQMVYLEKSLWFLGTRKEQNLIQFDLESGKLDYKKIGFCPSEICSIPKEVDGVGTVWAVSYGQNSGEAQDILSLINLTEKKVLPIDFFTFYKPDFIAEELNLNGKFPFMGNISIYDSDEMKIVSAFCTCTKCSSRQLYKLNSIEPFDVSYLGIKWNYRCLSNIISNNEHIIVTGNPLVAGFDGLEAGVYSVNGGAQQKYAKLPDGNQLFYQEKDRLYTV